MEITQNSPDARVSSFVSVFFAIAFAEYEAAGVSGCPRTM